MNIVNRGFIKVKALQPFIQWANTKDEEFHLDNDIEPNIYLIEEDFFDVEPLIKSNFKKIFLNELEMVDDDADNYPEITFDTFNEWFSIEIGNTVFDCEDSDLN
ncbi:MAG: hypothetical protein QNK23_12740 [Crocinitomicaceae bacterium]|nr:hypothetical protein [Crocinitomicaceae bacterium]